MKKLAEIAINIGESIVLGWFVYALSYQNYLLYKWHRGIPLPSKLPFVALGIVSALIFLTWKYRGCLECVRRKLKEL
ncbi:hypothetical protein PNA2_1349 [Pyrococcus sp. NA2]|uniref:hypothetical protein n=1 Tax=Pyrococcus sp. (strain NA2) TaxID=342949 RepID=UPI000209AE0C|nr:hypothetical protein [Pyrococcus sp. NA2]AEC52264.1 hypothetical protein PNA2_1349 [Pyrococcus sp. NA2]